MGVKLLSAPESHWIVRTEVRSRASSRADACGCDLPPIGILTLPRRSIYSIEKIIARIKSRRQSDECLLILFIRGII